jgi:meso-butanediol dehydrogenase/(S,S)-butanediol dehydrogenase/diacetyl reductase
MKGLAGKRVVVSGGSSGIGAATAQRFRDEGAEVIVLARRPGASGIACDVSDRDQVQQAFALVGDLDVLINNAGISARNPALDITPEQWDGVIATNLSGAFWAAQAAGQLMLKGRGGVILNTASTNALVGYRYYADYNATKAGLVALTKSLALEWAPKVRVNAVCPGYVLTPMQEAEYSPAMLAEVNGRIPLGRHATPEEIAGLFANLAADEATNFTGAVIVMDGGETAGSVISGPGGPGGPSEPGGPGI